MADRPEYSTTLIRVSADEMALLRLYRSCNSDYRLFISHFAEAAFQGSRQSTPDNLVHFPLRKQFLRVRKS